MVLLDGLVLPDSEADGSWTSPSMFGHWLGPNQLKYESLVSGTFSPQLDEAGGRTNRA